MKKSAKKYQPYRRHQQTDAVSWLNHNPHGASILATAARLMQLQQHVEAALPAPINTACQIIRWQDDALLLAVPTSAHSAKLRQLLPRLADALQSRGWQINEIRVRVQAPTRLPAPPAPLSPEQRPYITPDGLTAFAELAAQLPAQGPLAQSLARLLQRRQA